MSFAYKKLFSSDTSINEYKSNKQFQYDIGNLLDNNSYVFIGENIPISGIQIFDPINDDQTSNDEYKRLIFSSIKHLYYKNYKDNILVSSI